MHKRKEFSSPLNRKIGTNDHKSIFKKLKSKNHLSFDEILTSDAKAV